MEKITVEVRVPKDGYYRYQCSAFQVSAGSLVLSGGYACGGRHENGLDRHSRPVHPAERRSTLVLYPAPGAEVEVFGWTP